MAYRQRVDTPEYRKAYNRGWRTSEHYTDGALERADARGEPDPWYDGYMDSATGRNKWHLLWCPDHDAPVCPEPSNV